MTIRLRPATLADAALLSAWDKEPHVVRATTDDPDATAAFGGHDWRDDLAAQDEFDRFYVAELDGRPLGVIHVIDPKHEASHYWGEIPADLRAIDIWIGPKELLGKGHGEKMMRLAIDLCFAEPRVTAVLIDPLASNTRSHKFYERLGFVAEERRRFGEDDCLVMRLMRGAWSGR